MPVQVLDLNWRSDTTVRWWNDKGPRTRALFFGIDSLDQVRLLIAYMYDIDRLKNQLVWLDDQCHFSVSLALIRSSSSLISALVSATAVSRRSSRCLALRSMVSSTLVVSGISFSLMVARVVRFA